MSRLKSCLASAADAVFTIRVQRDAEVVGPGLGILQLLLRLTIFAYIIIYVMIIQKGYCIVAPVAGTLRLSVRAPAADVTATPQLPRGSQQRTNRLRRCKVF